jgi:MinD superfamily P-loop ATPase
MIISVASGKGGTGKTTVTASLASVWGGPLTCVDLDVEEPNLQLFTHPEIQRSETVYMEVPEVDESKCTACGMCSDLCQFKAITVMAGMVMTFPEMCHGCGGCMAVCPEKAISPGRRELGVMEEGVAGNNSYLMGRLRIGEAMSPPLMRVVKKRLTAKLAGEGGDAVIDAPPGVSCPAVNAVMDSDFIVLVTEPTPFGFYDFKLAHEAFSEFGKPMGAVINRAGLGDDSVEEYCRQKNLPVLARIPYDRKIAEAYSRGELITSVGGEIEESFIALRDAIKKTVQEAAHA